MHIDPADPRGPAYMGCLIAGENRNRAAGDEAANWLLAASALEAAQMRLGGLKHLTPNILYPPGIPALELGLAHAAGEQLLKANRPQDALLIVHQAIDDGDRVAKPLWKYPIPQAMLPIPSLQGTTVPHMNPLKAPPVYVTTEWMINLHELAGKALKEMGQADQATQEYSAAQDLKQELEQAQRSVPPPPRRR